MRIDCWVIRCNELCSQAFIHFSLKKWWWEITTEHWAALPTLSWALACTCWSQGAGWRMNYSSARPYAPAPLLTWGESLLLQPFHHLLHWQQPEEPSRHRNKGVNHEFLSVPDALFLKAPDYLLAVGNARLVPKHKQSLRWWQRIFLSCSPLCSRCCTSTPQTRLKCLFTPQGPPQEKSWSLGDGQGSAGAGGPGSRGCAPPYPRFGRAGHGWAAGQLGQPWERGQAEARLGHLLMGGSGLVGHGRAALWGAGD